VEVVRYDAELDPPVPPVIAKDAAFMRPFYRKLSRLMRGKARDHLRIAVYGDSNLTKDQFTSWLRNTLQARYGDGGHGFVAATRPWPWYFHRDVRHGGMGFASFACSTQPAPDKVYGFACIAGDSQQDRATLWLETAPAGSAVGSKAGRADVFFAKRPKGGVFEVLVDGASRARVETESPTVEAAVERVRFEEGPHRVEVRTTGNDRSVRLFGMALEREAPGVVIDSLGVGAAGCVSFEKQDRKTEIQALRARGHDLVVYALGANYTAEDRLPKCIQELVDRHREATPETPVLVFGPPDFSPTEAGVDNHLAVEANVKLIQRITRDVGVAFWDYRAAMGGLGAIERFQKRSMVWTDHVHLTDKGHAFMASRFLRALWDGLGQALDEDPRLGCDDGT
jgi:lysophospholipase L1-like esterase